MGNDWEVLEDSEVTTFDTGSDTEGKEREMERKEAERKQKQEEDNQPDQDDYFM